MMQTTHYCLVFGEEGNDVLNIGTPSLKFDPDFYNDFPLKFEFIDANGKSSGERFVREEHVEILYHMIGRFLEQHKGKK